MRARVKFSRENQDWKSIVIPSANKEIKSIRKLSIFEQQELMKPKEAPPKPKEWTIKEIVKVLEKRLLEFNFKDDSSGNKKIVKKNAQKPKRDFTLGKPALEN